LGGLSGNALAADLLDATNDAYLYQHVTGFTRHRSGQRSSLLDVVLSFNASSIQFVQHHSPLGSSDHECLTWQYECLFKNPTVLKVYQDLTTSGKEITVLGHVRKIKRDKLGAYT